MPRTSFFMVHTLMELFVWKRLAWGRQGHLKKYYNLKKNSSDFNFTVPTWFLGNVLVKPYTFHNTQCPLPPEFGRTKIRTEQVENLLYTISPPGFDNLTTALLLFIATFHFLKWKIFRPLNAFLQVIELMF